MAFSAQEAQRFAQSLRDAHARTERATAEAMRRRVQAERDRVVAEQTARSGGIPPALEAMVVDRQRGASLDAVKADSTVLLDWNYLREAATVVRDDLIQHGPQLKGDWQRGIIVLYQGAQIEPEALPPDARECRVVASVIYSRMLEVGKRDDGRPFSVRGFGLVQERAIQLRRRLANIARVAFNYVDLEDAPEISRGAQIRTRFVRGVRRAESRRRGETRVRYPAIFLEEIRG